MRKGLYIYPDAEECITVMDFDDLNPESLLILCTECDGENIAYVWRGFCFEEVKYYFHPFINILGRCD